jgi:O-antigen/teichoic acid export membrane protein
MTVLILVAAIFCIGLNYVLIPKYNGLGAAIAYLLTTLLVNFCTWFYLKYRFKMQPFSYKHLLVIIIAVVSWAAGRYFWRMPNVLLDIVIRSGIAAAIYGLLAYYFKISADINEKVDKTLKKVYQYIR